MTPLRDGRTRYVEADAAGTMPLEGHSLCVEVENDVRVVIDPTATG